MRKKKKKPQGPRVKRMRRAARLQSARSWLEKYEGKNVVRGYRKRFGVDLACAYKELQMLGLQFDPSVVAARLKSAAADAAARRRKRIERAERTTPYGEMYADYNETFTYIAGRTSGGVPFGITWGEMKEFEERELDSPSQAGHFEYDPEYYYDGDSQRDTHEFDDLDADIPF
jgi:hypothetical protein